MKHQSISILFFTLQMILFVVYFMVPEMYRFQFPLAITIVGWFIFSIGILTGISGSLTLGRYLSPFPEPLAGAKLKTSGIYQYFRHPLYISVILFFGGIALIRESLVKLMFTVIFYLFFSIKASYEEKRLLKKFPGYNDYRMKTRSFLLNWKT